MSKRKSAFPVSEVPKPIRGALRVRPLTHVLALSLVAIGAFGFGLVVGQNQMVAISELADRNAKTLNTSEVAKVSTMPKGQTIDEDELAKKSGAHLLSGELKSIQANTLIVSVSAAQLDPTRIGVADRTFFTTDDPIVFQQVEKLVAQYKVESAEYGKLLATYNETMDERDFDPTKILRPSKPEPYSMEKITFGELKVGDFIELRTESDLNSLNPLLTDSIRLVSRPDSTDTTF